MTLHVPAPDGRLLEVLVSGPGDGFPLVFHHGTPQAAVPDPVLEAAAAERGLRVVAWSRPGYGGSTPRADGATTATVADDAADVAVILDHLGLGEFLSVGWSGGGPRSLACAAVRVPRPLPEVGFVRSAISLATRRAYAAPGHRYVATLGSWPPTSVTA
jgi:pimeloyl-ACP methyl ester carboxylesterase